MSEALINPKNNKELVTEIEIIDETFNFQSLKYWKTMKVFIYSDMVLWMPTLKFIGDIIRLKRFKIKNEDFTELHESVISNWFIIDDNL